MRVNVKTLVLSIAVLLALIGFALLPAAGQEAASPDQKGSSQSAKNSQDRGNPGTPAESQTSPANAAQATKSSERNNVVWVNTASKTYHRKGSKWFGKTRHGKYMTEGDAIKAGYHAAEKD